MRQEFGYLRRLVVCKAKVKLKWHSILACTPIYMCKDVIVLDIMHGTNLSAMKLTMH